MTEDKAMACQPSTICEGNLSTPDSDGDIVLQVEGREILAQRKALANSSAYFQAMFQSNMKESQAKRVELHGITYHLLQQLVDSLNDHPLKMDLENVYDILPAASMFQFADAIEQCEGFLLNQLSSENCLNIMYLADSCGIHQLFNRARMWALYRFPEVIKTDDFIHLTKDVLLDYLCDDMLNATCELEVFDAAVRWTLSQGCGENILSQDVLKAVRLGCLSDSQLSVVKDHPLVKNNEHLQIGFLVEEINMIKDTQSKKAVVGDTYMPRSVPVDVWLMGGKFLSPETSSEDRALQEVLKLDPDTKKLEPATKLPFPVSDPCEEFQGMRACLLGWNVYLCGGVLHHGSKMKWLTDVYCYDTLHMQWNIVAQLRRPRRHHSLVAWDNHLCLIGGFGKHRIILDNVEKYDIDKGVWHQVTPLLWPEYAAAGCHAAGGLMVIKQGIQLYSPQTDQWTKLHIDLPYEIGIQTSVCLGNKVYVSGAYSPQLLEIDVETWSAKKIGKFKDACGPMALKDNKLYVVGGEDSEYVEAYCLRTETFVEVMKLQQPMHNHCVLSIPAYPKFR